MRRSSGRSIQVFREELLMMRRLSVLVLVLLSPLSPWSAETASQIVKKSDEKTRGKTSYIEMTMEIVRPTWTRVHGNEGVVQGIRLLPGGGPRSPPGDKGSSSLKRGTEMWNWVPNIERIIKIAPSMLSQSWMGSDFTNDDLINQSSLVVDYTHALTGEEDYDGVKCWVIEATPQTQRASGMGETDALDQPRRVQPKENRFL
jgi:outer membrane lipoprotein-sorting protein